MAIAYQHKSYVSLEFEKVVKIYMHTCTVFVGLATNDDICYVGTD